MKRLLFFDIDGTLAIPGQTPSKETVNAIRSARTNGHKAFLCTGRTEGAVPSKVQEIGFDGGIYSAGGRVVVEGRTILDQTMPHNIAQMILSAMQKENLLFTLEYSNRNYQSSLESLSAATFDMSKGNSELQRILLSSKQTPMSQYHNEPVYKISFLAELQEQIDRMAQMLDNTVKVVSFENLIPDIPFIAGEVSDKNIHKGQALRRVCKYFGIPSEMSVAFGDSMNDAEMLLDAGIGIEMGNSSEQVKALADQVCESCADNGVAATLFRLGLAGPV